MSMKTIAIAVAMMVAAAATPAQADLSAGGIFDRVDGSFFKKSGRRSSLGAGRRSGGSASYPVTRTYYSGGGYKVGRRPRKWCGWWMRTQKGGGPKFNVAWNWRHYGRPSGPQIGAVVVWRHHVGIITGRAADGRWIVKSGNDGGRVRERARSVRGAIFRI